MKSFILLNYIYNTASTHIEGVFTSPSIQSYAYRYNCLELNHHCFKLEFQGFFGYRCVAKAIAGSSNGRTSASEAEYLGSSPGPAAKTFAILYI